MNRKQAKQILYSYRPNRPQKSEKRQLQQAIDIAMGTIDAYDNLLKAVSVDIRSKWKPFKDTLQCTNCGFGYFPTNLFFMNGEPIDADVPHRFVFKHCPNCGEKMGNDK